jgi:hypothetical protein
MSCITTLQSPSPEVSIVDQLWYFQKDTRQPTEFLPLLHSTRGHTTSGTQVTGDVGAFNSDPRPAFEDPREPNGLDAPLTNQSRADGDGSPA